MTFSFSGEEVKGFAFWPTPQWQPPLHLQMLPSRVSSSPNLCLRLEMLGDCSEAGSKDSDLTSQSLEFGSQGQGAALWLSVGPYSEFSWGHSNHSSEMGHECVKDASPLFSENVLRG